MTIGQMIPLSITSVVTADSMAILSFICCNEIAVPYWCIQHDVTPPEPNEAWQV